MSIYKQKAQKKVKSGGKKKLLVFGLAVVVLAAAGGGTYALYRRHHKPVPVSTGTINYTPASPVEKKESEDNKDRIVKDQTQQSQASSSQPTSGKKAVTPTITNTTGQVNAYVSGIFEEGGTCTATFTKGSTVLTKTSQGFQNVSYTQCAPMDLDSGFLSSGTWSITVKYSSDTSEGVSAAQTIEVK